MQPLQFEKYMKYQVISLTPAGIIKFYCFNGSKKADQSTSKTIVLWFCYQVMKLVPFLGTGEINYYYGILARNRDKKKGGKKVTWDLKLNPSAVSLSADANKRPREATPGR
jgi:hypothetical protein